MADYSILFKESVQKDLYDIPKNDLKKNLTRIKSLGTDPRPSGCEKLTGLERYRLRQGRYRIVYAVRNEEKEVMVVKVGHRKDI
jgi:mRNA interferase RelE/StbE